jgi:hypothetical protein
LTTKTTVHLKLPDPRAWWNLPTPAAAAIVVFCLIVIAALVGRIRSAPPIAVQPTPGLIILIATPAPAVPARVQPAPAQQVAAVQLPATVRYVTAWAAPGGDVLGPIPWNTDSPMLGRFGDGWILTQWGNGQVWVRASDIGLNLPNLAPAIAPQPGPRAVYVEQPPAAPQAPEVNYTTDNQPPPPAPPEQPQQPVAPREAVPVAAPPAAPTLVPAVIEEAAAPILHDDEITAEWARVQQNSENCVSNECYP